ncbi:hypothetical protein N431DRAFT_551967 [Stipitochalara longipes BDJ]|nr:hypothetical protein N431DRAFT_551967 [Stipitochalara longipes BDJ]
MDLSNFDFDALDQASRDEMLAQLSYPIDPDFDLYPFSLVESAALDWQQPVWQYTGLTGDNAHAYNEHQGAIPSNCQGQTPSPNMLVEFHPQHNSQQNDKTYYSLVPWSGNVSVEGPPALAQGISTSGFESVESHDDFDRIAAPDLKRIKAQDLKRIEEARAASCCTWKDCPLTHPFSNDTDLEHHLEGHAQDVLQRWSGAAECSWSGCVSRERFKFLSPLRLHLQNAHVNPLLCFRPNCFFKRPFRNHRDLQRHIETKHSQTGEFRCPYKECKTNTATFKRKDKWLKHVQDAQHQLDNSCPVQHCEKEERQRSFAGFKNPKEAIHHMFNEHGITQFDVRDFSCTIGGCEHGDPPYLTKDQLKYHLLVDHGFLEGAQNIVEAVEATELHQLSMGLVPRGINYHACKLCSPPRRLCSPPLSPLRAKRVYYCS